MSDPAKALYWRDYTASEHFLGDYKSELHHANQQLRTSPGRLTTQLVAIRALAGLGRGSEALTRVGEAMELGEDSVARVAGGMTPGHFAYQAATELRVHGDSMAARVAARRAVAWYGADSAARLAAGRYERQYLARSLLLLDRLDEALAVVGAPTDTTDIFLLSLKGVLAARQGRRDQARELDQRIAAMSKPDLLGLVETQQVRVKLAVGERDSAFALLQRCAAGGRVIRTPLGNDIHSDPLLDGMRGDERFERINRGG
jgi:hypothetical protein